MERKGYSRGSTRPEEHEPVVLALTPEQQRQISEYMGKTGRQVGVSLVVDVVEGKIAPAAVSVGAV